jgi:glutathione S-transferase
VTDAVPELAYFPGSPFARMARVLVREWALPVSEVAVPFPPPDWLCELSPLGQVPVLSVGDEGVFPTLFVLERLWRMAGAPREAYAGPDRVVLVTVLAAGDALVAALYQRWAGLQPVGSNHVGYDPGERNLARFERVFGWLAARPRVREGVTLPGVAVACIVLWSDARGGPAWWGHGRLDRLVAGLATRPSFRDTEPPPWRPDRVGEEETR